MENKSTALVFSTPKDLRRYAPILRAQMDEVIPKTAGINAETIVQGLILLTAQFPDLLNPRRCEPASLLMAAVQAARVGLPLDPQLGRCAIVPRGGKATLMIMYRGLMDLMRRSGVVDSVYPDVIYSNDEWGFVAGLPPKLTHKPNLAVADRGAMVLAYAVAIKNGEPIHYVWCDAAEVERHRKYNKLSGSDSSPWQTAPAEMWKKTAVRKLAKDMPLSLEIIQQISAVGALVDLPAASVAARAALENNDDDALDAVFHRAQEDAAGNNPETGEVFK